MEMPALESDPLTVDLKKDQEHWNPHYEEVRAEQPGRLINTGRRDREYLQDLVRIDTTLTPCVGRKKSL